MKSVFSLLPLLVLLGCATPQMPRDAVSMTVPTTKIKSDVMKSVTLALVTNGYQIRTIDKESGIISTEGKQFGIPRGVFGVVHEGKSRLQVLVLDNIVQLQIMDECRYDQVNTTAFSRGGYAVTTSDAGFSMCSQGDIDANSVLPEHDWKIQNVIRVALGQPELPPLPPPPKPKMDPNQKRSDTWYHGS